MNTSSSIPIGAAAQHSWLAVVAVGLATFSVVTTEMLPVGLLTPIADTLHTSTGTAGLMISLPALLAALFAPLVEIASALYVSVFNIGIALGSWVGGQAVDSSGPIATLWLAGGFAATALLLSLSMKLTESRESL